MSSQLLYKVRLTEGQYAELMRLVMRYGTAITGDDMGTSTDLRRALVDVEFQTVPPTVDSQEQR